MTMALDDPTSDSGHFGSSELWQCDDSNPFGSLIELAYKLKSVNKEFRRRFLDVYGGSAKIRQSLYLSDVVESGCKYEDFEHGADHAFPMPFMHQSNSKNHYSHLMDDQFGSSLQQNPSFLSQQQKKFTGISKKYKNIDAQLGPGGLHRTQIDNNSSDENSHARQSASDTSTRKSARLESLLHDPRQKHNCPLCIYQTDNRCHLRRHLSSIHNAAKAYYCYICKKEFSRSERVKSHFLNIHPEISYHPKIVRKELYLMDDPMESEFAAGAFDDPGNVPAQPETFETTHATKYADSENELSSQKSWERYCEISTQPSDNQKIFTCRQCSFGGGDIWLMKKHYLDAHLGATTYVCRICRYASSCVTRLVSHMLGHGELICSYCSYSTAEVKQFEKHLRECSLVTRCLVCELDFADKDQLQEHTLATHQRFCCNECPFTSGSASELDAHLEVHAVSNSSLIQEIERDDEVLLGPYRSRAEAQDSGAPSLAPKRSLDSHTSTVVTDSSAAVVEQNWNRIEEKMLDKVLAKVNVGNVFSCLVPGCGFRASWKKSLELHSENYHNINFNNSNDQTAALAFAEKNTRSLGSAECLASGFFPCPFCPNCRTFKYRKSFEKHLSQHGVDHQKHPDLIARLNRKGD